MLQILRGKNFQNHSDIEVDLRHPITTITGPSDSGKSALIRLLKWVCTNTPQGDGFVKYGTDEARAGVVFDDGTMVQRVRGKSENLYKLGSKEFRAFGTTVPDDIATLLNLGPINFQGQHDSVFWFSETAGEVSRRLNSVVDLGIIDTTFANISSKVRSLQAVIQVHKDRVEKKRAELKELAWITEADRVVTGIEQLANVAAVAGARAAAASELIQTIKTTRASVVAAGVALENTRSVGRLGQEAGRRLESLTELGDLVATIRALKAVVDMGVPDLRVVDEAANRVSAQIIQMRMLDNALQAAKNAKVRVDRGHPNIGSLETLVETVKEKHAKFNALFSLKQTIRVSVASVQRLKSDYDSAHGELEAASVGNCPVCGKEMLG
jgi:DNA repair ATPase RecN